MLTMSKAAQIKLGRRKGKVAKMPSGEKRDGRDLAGSANVPPIAGPMMVPIDHTNGMTAYARAIPVRLVLEDGSNDGLAYAHVLAS